MSEFHVLVFGITLLHNISRNPVALTIKNKMHQKWIHFNYNYPGMYCVISMLAKLQITVMVLNFTV